MQRCVLESEAKAKASVESRVSAKVTAALAEAADENMTRFEDLTGKLDQLEKMFEQNSQIVEQRLSRVLAALDAGSSWPNERTTNERILDDTRHRRQSAV